jgi:hypothetical protein
MTSLQIDSNQRTSTLKSRLPRAHTHPETDLCAFSNLSMDTLDYTGPAVNEESKGCGWDLEIRSGNCRGSSAGSRRRACPTYASSAADIHAAGRRIVRN